MHMEAGRATDSSRLVLSGNTVALPNLKNVNDTLLGWYTDKAFRKEFNASTPVKCFGVVKTVTFRFEKIYIWGLFLSTFSVTYCKILS